MDTLKHISQVLPDVLAMLAHRWFFSRFGRRAKCDTELFFAFNYFIGDE